MSSEIYNKIVDITYMRYHSTMNSDEWIENWVEPGEKREQARKNKGNNGYTKEEFINEIKTNDEFAKKWGLKIEEIKLSQSQRFNWYGDKIGSFMHHDHIEQEMDEYGVPTKQIIITQKDTIIQIYE